MANLSLVFDLVGRDLSASKAFKDVGDSAERAGKQGENSGGLIAKGMKLAGGALLGAGLIEGFKSLYDAAAESAKIGALTTQVIKSTGGAAGVSAKQVGDLAGAIAKKTGVDDEAIQSGENLLLTFTNVKNAAGEGNDIFDQTTRIMTDMSVALGTDASGSAIQLGKALNDPIKGVSALQKVGVSFTETQKEQIRTLVETGDTMGAQKVILAELSKEFGGAAEAAATPFGKLQQRLGDLAETLGSNLIPYVDQFSTFLIDDVLPGVTDVGGVVAGELGPALGLAVDFLKEIVDVGGNVIGFFTDLPGPVQTLVIGLGAAAALKGPIGQMFNTIRDTAETAYLRTLLLKDTMGGLGGAGGVAKAGLGGLTSFFGGPWGLALAGASAGVTLLATVLGNSDDASKDAETAQRGFADALRDSKGAIDENVRSAAAKAAQDAGLLDTAKALGIALPDVTDAVLGNEGALTKVTAAANAYIDASLSYEHAGDPEWTKNAQGAQAFIDGLNTLAPTVQQNAADQEQLAAATAGTDAALGATRDTASLFADQMTETQGEVDDAKKAVDNFKLALDILTGANVSMIEVQGAFYDALSESQGALDGLSGSALDNSGSLDQTSESGRKASDVLIDIRNSGNDLIATMKQQGASQDEVRAKEDELRQSFINSAGQMGITGDAAQALADQILGIPSQRSTAINADTTQATNAINTFLNSLPKTVTMTGDYVARPGVAVRKAFGGSVFGPGTETSDSIPALLSNNEHVWSAAEVRGAGGHSVMENMRQAARNGTLAAFAAGGGVFADQFRNGRITLPVGLTGLPNPADLMPANTAGSGSGMSGAWTSIWNIVKAAIPQARINSTYRPGDPGYHGKNKAIDFGFGSGAGGAGSAGLASIARFLYRGYGRSLAEIIYDGIGDDTPDVKNGADHVYNAATRADHHNHVHAAVYDGGGILQPGYTLAYNGTGKGETIRTAEQEAALSGPRTIIHDNRKVYAQVDARRLAVEMRQEQCISEFLHG